LIDYLQKPFLLKFTEVAKNKILGGDFMFFQNKPNKYLFDIGKSNSGVQLLCSLDIVD